MHLCPIWLAKAEIWSLGILSMQLTYLLKKRLQALKVWAKGSRFAPALYLASDLHGHMSVCLSVVVLSP
eukprot:scaffold114602_cov12-Tisochrysis_lutea.AAC.1